MRDLIGLARLPRDRRSLVAVALLLQIGARALVALLPLPRVVALSSRLGAARRARPIDPDALRWALRAAAARAGGSCLTQALAARVLLAWSGRPCRLAIGVRRQPGGPEFHAWADAAELAFPSNPDPAAYAEMAVWS